MNTMYLNPKTWDLTVDDYGNIATASNPYAVAQDVASAAKLWSGEARYNTAAGVPYENGLLGRMPPISIVQQWYEGEALTVPDVEAVAVELRADAARRELTGQIRITLEDGTEAAVEV